MKIDRLIAILSVLLQKKMVTAPYLAEQFEVSRRTINRDIEDLCKAGIPIVTRQGVNGGISIMDNYKLERTLLTNTDMQDILAGLRSLDSVNGTNRYGQLMEKLASGSSDTSDFVSGNQSMLIDLSSWYKDSLVPKIELIRNAVDSCRELKFRYYAPHGESIRCIKPYYLIFRWSSWYVWGWCHERKDFRLFKLNRMDELQLSETVFKKQVVPLPDLSNEHVFPSEIRAKAVFAANCKWRLIEEFGLHCFEEQMDGTLLFQADYSNKENLIAWILTFREQAELLEPEDIRRDIQEIIEKMKRRYS